MATFDYSIPYKKADGTANIRIVVRHQRRKKEFATNIILQPTDFTKGGKIKNYKVLDTLEDLLSTYRKKCQALGLRINNMSVEDVVEFIRKEDSEDFHLDFFEYGEKLSKKKKPNTGHNIYVALQSFKAFLGRDKLDINELTTRLLQDYIEFNANKLANNSIIAYIRNIKVIFHAAQNEYNDEDTDTILIKKNPFKKLQLPSNVLVKKRSISADIIRNIYKLEDKKQPVTKDKYCLYNFAKDMFILSFLLVGMNAIDLYHCGPIDKDGYITYNRTKTKDSRLDMAEIRIKVPALAYPIIEKYKDTEGTHLLGLHKHYLISRLNDALSTGMKNVSEDIGEKVTFYSARHSWATIAVNDVGIDKYTVHLALNHTDQSTAITDVYIRKDFSVIDKANDKVIDYINFQS